MSGVNKCIIIGHMGQDPESRQAGATAVTNFSVATSEQWTDKGTGEKKDRVEWHKIVTFGKTAENCAKYLAKGRQVFVEGKLQTSSYEKDGQTHYATKIVADTVQFLGGKNSPGGQSGGGYQPGGQRNGGYAPAPQSQGYNQGQIPPEDSIPF